MTSDQNEFKEWWAHTDPTRRKWYLGSWLGFMGNVGFPALCGLAFGEPFICASLLRCLCLEGCKGLLENTHGLGGNINSRGVMLKIYHYEVMSSVEAEVKKESEADSMRLFKVTTARAQKGLPQHQKATL